MNAQPKLSVNRRRWPLAITAIALLTGACSNNAPAAPPTFEPNVTILTPSPPPVPTTTPVKLVTVTPDASGHGECRDDSGCLPTAVPLRGMSTATPVSPLANGINPYTGLPVEEAVLVRRPLLVKISNEGEAVWPQTGMSAADVVIEHITEGGVTRFNALYLTHWPDKVGSVRSCRLPDIEFPMIFDAGLVCSGTSPGVGERMRRSPAYLDQRTMINDLAAFECATCPVYRTRDARLPHNLFANTLNALTVLDERGRNRPTEFRSWTFDATAPNDEQPASSIHLPYVYWPVDWRYDSKTGLWTRRMKNRPHLDKATGKALTADTIVVAYAHHETTDIVEDRAGSLSIEVQVWGDGPLKVFRDGRVIEGKWIRPSEPGILRFVDHAGRDIPLKPGVTWIQFVPLDFDVRVQ